MNLRKKILRGYCTLSLLALSILSRRLLKPCLASLSIRISNLLWILQVKITHGQKQFTASTVMDMIKPITICTTKSALSDCTRLLSFSGCNLKEFLIQVITYIEAKNVYGKKSIIDVRQKTLYHRSLVRFMKVSFALYRIVSSSLHQCFAMHRQLSSATGITTMRMSLSREGKGISQFSQLLLRSEDSPSAIKELSRMTKLVISAGLKVSRASGKYLIFKRGKRPIHCMQSIKVHKGNKPTLNHDSRIHYKSKTSIRSTIHTYPISLNPSIVLLSLSKIISNSSLAQVLLSQASPQMSNEI